MTTLSPVPVPAPGKPGPARRKGAQADSEALLSPLKPINNWQAKFAWSCACWGLIPVLVLPLGASATAFGLLGCVRAWPRPDDLVRRAPLGGALVRGFELFCSSAGTHFFVAPLPP